MADVIQANVPIGNSSRVETAEDIQPGLLKMPIWVWLALAGAAFWLWKRKK